MTYQVPSPYDVIEVMVVRIRELENLVQQLKNEIHYLQKQKED